METKQKYQRPSTCVHHCTMVGMLCLSDGDQVQRTSGNAELKYGGGGSGRVRTPEFKGVMDE